MTPSTVTPYLTKWQGFLQSLKEKKDKWSEDLYSFLKFDVIVQKFRSVQQWFKTIKISFGFLEKYLVG